MEENNTTVGIGFFGLLQLVFITMKLLDKIKWSWWIVLSPTLVWLGIMFVLLIVLGYMHYKY